MSLFDTAHTASIRTILDLCGLRILPELRVFWGSTLGALPVLAVIWEDNQSIDNVLESSVLEWGGVESSGVESTYLCI